MHTTERTIDVKKRYNNHETQKVCIHMSRGIISAVMFVFTRKKKDVV